MARLLRLSGPVRQPPTGEAALELEDPQKYAAGLRLAPNLGSVPHFAEERTLAGTHPAAAASAHAQLAAIPKPELGYSGPPGVALGPVEGGGGSGKRRGGEEGGNRG